MRALSHGCNTRIAHRRSSGSLADPAPLGHVKEIVRRILDDTTTDVYLFGSWARGTQRATSDIDIAIESSKPRGPIDAPRDPHAVGPALRLDEGSCFLIAATRSFDPDPHREMDLMASVNGMSTRCTRSRLRM